MKLLTTTISILAGALFLAAGSAAAGPAPAHYSDADYAAVLARFVDDQGLVDYAGLKAKRAQLDAYVAAIATLDPQRYEEWDVDARKAFWINAYNALTLRSIVDHYPIQPQPGREAYPKNSIRQIPGVWDQRQARVMGKEITLDQIEHEVLRRDFLDARLHMALVCAAMSCPPLRSEPYNSSVLDTQMDDQSRRFLSDLRNFHIDREKNEVWASEIFKWFADDFLLLSLNRYERHVFERMALVNFVSAFVGEADRDFLKGTTWTLHYFKYDWSLNEQPK